MSKHQQPTKEELEANIAAAIETPKEEDKPDLEPELTLEEAEKEQEEIKILKETLEVEPQSLSDEQKDILRKNADKLPEEQKEYYKDILTPPEDKEDEEEDKKGDEDEKDKKLSASARENQKIYAKNRVLNQAIVEANEIPEPTDEEMAKEFPEFDVMSDVERSLAKETIVTRKWREKIKEASNQANKIEKWNESVESFIDDPETYVKMPELEGKQDAFREFATSPESNSVPFKMLVNAFLYEKEKGKIKNKGSMFPSGNGGPNSRPEVHSDTISLEEAMQLKKTDYAKYKEYLMARKIRVDL